MNKKLKELNSGKNFLWIAKTQSGKILMSHDAGSVSLKAHRKDAGNKDTIIKKIISVPASGKDDTDAKEELIVELKNELGLKDSQIKKLNFMCVRDKDIQNAKVESKKQKLNKILEQKQLRLDVDDTTVDLAYDIIYYFEHDLGCFELKTDIDTIDVIDPENEEQICKILIWNKKYLIFIDDGSYYYIGRNFIEFEKDFEEVYKDYYKEIYGEYRYEDNYLEESNHKKDGRYKIVWTNNLEDANKFCPQSFWKYFDGSTVPKFLSDKDVPGKKYGFVIDFSGRPLAGIAVYINGKKEDDYKDESLPYIWELGSVSKNPKIKGQVPCPWAQKGTGTALVKDFAKKVNYEFWFKTASGSADSYWNYIAKSGDLGKVLNLYLLGYSTWGDPEYSTIKPDESLIDPEVKNRKIEK